jgi:hypothetical protein
LIEFGGAMVAYTVVLLVAVTLLNRLDDENIWRLPLAVAPVIPIGFALWAFLRQLGRMDELQRRIQLDAIATAAGATGMITATWGFLELAGVPPLPTIWVFPLLIALWGLATAFFSRRYQ